MKTQKDTILNDVSKRNKENLRVDMEYDRVNYVRKKLRTPGYRGEFLETLLLVYIAMTVSFIFGLVVASGA